MKELKGFKVEKEAVKALDEAGIGQDYAKKYDGYSEDDLIGVLAKSVKKAKEDGTYSKADMDNFISLISPKLTDVQRVKLSNLTKLIEEDGL
ncbi:MAG: hypothetical protein FWD86_02325 [Firmicutes bacterium]|nr:hypothetical protein [Bacillota bacterium]